MLQSSPLLHLRRLVEPGPRPIGSSANQAAADYIHDQFSSLGYQVEEQPYDCIAFEEAGAVLEIDGQPAPVEVNPFSLPCDVRGAPLPLCSLAELDAADIGGRIVLFYGELASATISPKSWFLKTERDDQILRRLENGRPAALIAPSAASVEYLHLTLDWELDLPAATIPFETVLRLVQQPGSSLHLTLQGRRVPSQARNIVARKPGSGAQRVVLCAHFDTMINTPGAMDNAGGVSIILALAGLLREDELPYTLEFIAFNGEEYLPIGDDEYVRRAGDTFEQILFALNIDGAGAAYTTTSITMMSAAAGFQAQVEKITAAYPGVTWVEPWPESNHSTFAMRGVPSLAVSSVGARHLAHTPEDTLAVMSEKKIEEALSLAAEIIRSRPEQCRPR